MCETISLSKLINSVTVSYTFLLRQKRYKENPTILCKVCLATIERKHIFSHIIKVHAKATYCRLPLGVQFICTCTKSFTLSVLLEFLKHVWYCGIDNIDQQFTHFNKILDSAITSEEYLTLQNALAAADNSTKAVLHQSRSPAKLSKHSVPVPDEKYTLLVQSVHKIMEQVPLLKNLDKDQLHKIISYSEQLITTDLLTEYLLTSQKPSFIKNIHSRLTYFFETLDKKDVCSFCENLKGCPMLHYNTHLPSSSNKFSSIQLCGKCNKISILLTLSDLAKFFFHIINCVSNDKEKINSFCSEMERLFIENNVVVPDYKSPIVQFSATVKLPGVYELTEETRYLLTPESFTKDSPLDIIKSSSTITIPAKSDCILNCEKCDKDFSSFSSTNQIMSTDDDHHFFSTQEFLSTFSDIKPWLTCGLNFELFKGISGLKTYMLLSLHHISVNRFIFTHSFIFKAVCRSILLYCSTDPDICVLPNSCLCRDTIQYDLSTTDLSNTHRHCIIVFKSDDTYKKFTKYQSKLLVDKGARKCYTKKIDNTMHLAKTFYYCSYQKTPKKNIANRKRSYFRLQNDIDDCMGNIHFAFTSPVLYHFKPLIYICYKTGFEDWINEEYTQSESKLLNFFENMYVNTDAAYTFVPIEKVAPILSRYIKDHLIDIDTLTISQEKQELVNYLKVIDCPLITLFNISSEIKLFNVDKLVIPVSKHLYGQFQKLLNISSVDIRRNVKRTKLIHELLEVNNYQSELIKALIKENCELRKCINK